MVDLLTEFVSFIEKDSDLSSNGVINNTLDNMRNKYPNIGENNAETAVRDTFSSIKEANKYIKNNNLDAYIKMFEEKVEDRKRENPEYAVVEMYNEFNVLGETEKIKKNDAYKKNKSLKGDLDLMESNIKSSNKPSFLFIPGFINTMSKYDSHKTVKESVDKANKYVKDNRKKLVLLETVHKLDSIPHKIYRESSDVIKKALVEGDVSSHALEVLLEKKAKTPMVGRMIQELASMEHREDPDFFDIGKGNSNVKVQNYVGPVLREGNDVILPMGDSFVEISESQKSGYMPVGDSFVGVLKGNDVESKSPEFCGLTESMASLGFKVDGKGLYCNMRTNKLELKINENDELDVVLNGNDFKDTVSLDELFVTENNAVRKNAVRVLENQDKIYHISFLKFLMTESSVDAVLGIGNEYVLFEKVNTREKTMRKMNAVGLYEELMHKHDYDVRWAFDVELSERDRKNKEIEEAKHKLNEEIEKLLNSKSKLLKLHEKDNVKGEYESELNNLISKIDEKAETLKKNFLEMVKESEEESCDECGVEEYQVNDELELSGSENGVAKVLFVFPDGTLHVEYMGQEMRVKPENVKKRIRSTGADMGSACQSDIDKDEFDVERLEFPQAATKSSNPQMYEHHATGEERISAVVSMFKAVDSAEDAENHKEGLAGAISKKGKNFDEIWTEFKLADSGERKLDQSYVDEIYNATESYMRKNKIKIPSLNEEDDFSIEDMWDAFSDEDKKEMSDLLGEVDGKSLDDLVKNGMSDDAKKIVGSFLKNKIKKDESHTATVGTNALAPNPHADWTDKDKLNFIDKMTKAVEKNGGGGEAIAAATLKSLYKTDLEKFKKHKAKEVNLSSGQIDDVFLKLSSFNKKYGIVNESQFELEKDRQKEDETKVKRTDLPQPSSKGAEAAAKTASEEETRFKAGEEAAKVIKDQADKLRNFLKATVPDSNASALVLNPIFKKVKENDKKQPGEKSAVVQTEDKLMYVDDDEILDILDSSPEPTNVVKNAEDIKKIDGALSGYKLEINMEELGKMSEISGYDAFYEIMSSYVSAIDEAQKYLQQAYEIQKEIDQNQSLIINKLFATMYSTVEKQDREQMEQLKNELYARIEKTQKSKIQDVNSLISSINSFQISVMNALTMDYEMTNMQNVVGMMAWKGYTTKTSKDKVDYEDLRIKMTNILKDVVKKHGPAAKESGQTKVLQDLKRFRDEMKFGETSTFTEVVPEKEPEFRYGGYVAKERDEGELKKGMTNEEVLIKENAFDAFNSFMEKVKEFFKNVPSKIKEHVKGLFAGIAEWGKALMTNVGIYKNASDKLKGVSKKYLQQLRNVSESALPDHEEDENLNEAETDIDLDSIRKAAKGVEKKEEPEKDDPGSSVEKVFGTGEDEYKTSSEQPQPDLPRIEGVRKSDFYASVQEMLEYADRFKENLKAPFEVKFKPTKDKSKYSMELKSDMESFDKLIKLAKKSGDEDEVKNIEEVKEIYMNSVKKANELLDKRSETKELVDKIVNLETKLKSGLPAMLDVLKEENLLDDVENYKRMDIWLKGIPEMMSKFSDVYVKSNYFGTDEYVDWWRTLTGYLKWLKDETNKIVDYELDDEETEKRKEVARELFNKIEKAFINAGITWDNRLTHLSGKGDPKLSGVKGGESGGFKLDYPKQTEPDAKPEELLDDDMFKTILGESASLNEDNFFTKLVGALKSKLKPYLKKLKSLLSHIIPGDTIDVEKMDDYIDGLRTSFGELKAKMGE